MEPKPFCALSSTLGFVPPLAPAGPPRAFTQALEAGRYLLRTANSAPHTSCGVVALPTSLGPSSLRVAAGRYVLNDLAADRGPAIDFLANKVYRRETTEPVRAPATRIELAAKPKWMAAVPAMDLNACIGEHVMKTLL